MGRGGCSTPSLRASLCRRPRRCSKCARRCCGRIPASVFRSDSADFIRRFHGKCRLLYAVTPRFALSASEAMLEVCQTLLRENPGVRFQTHINENRDEIAEVARLFPWAADYLAVYERYALAGPGSV